MSGIILELLRQSAPPEKYAGKKVERETLRAIFAAGRVAPSADNLQIWRFVIAEDQAVREKLVASLTEERDRKLFAAAPTIVACLGAPWLLKSAKKEQPFFMIDVPIAVSHLLLAAVDLGLAPTFRQQLDERQMLAAAGAMSEKYRAVGLLALGYRA